MILCPLGILSFTHRLPRIIQGSSSDQCLHLRSFERAAMVVDRQHSSAKPCEFCSLIRPPSTSSLRVCLCRFADLGLASRYIGFRISNPNLRYGIASERSICLSTSFSNISSCDKSEHCLRSNSTDMKGGIYYCVRLRSAYVARFENRRSQSCFNDVGSLLTPTRGMRPKKPTSSFESGHGAIAPASSGLCDRTIHRSGALSLAATPAGISRLVLH